MAVIITPQKEIDAYFESESVNQSTLKDLIGGFDSYMFKKQKKENIENSQTPNYFLIGGAVDIILTGEEEEFENKYYVSQLEKKPSEAECLIINQVFDELKDNNIEIDMSLEEYPEMLSLAIVDQDWYKGKPGPKRTSGLIERGREYFEDLKNADGKEVLPSEMKNTIDKIVMSLTTNYRTKKYFDRQLQKELTNMDFYYQLPIYFMYEGVACKALLDLLVVEKNEKGEIISIEPIDLKTMSGNTLQFIDKVKQHRYDIQAAWYRLAIIDYFTLTDSKIIKPFKFIVESTTNIGTPLVFELSIDTLITGVIGQPKAVLKSEDSERRILYKEILGYEQLMKLYKYYEETNWKQDKILDENSGVILIDFNRGII